MNIHINYNKNSYLHKESEWLTHYKQSYKTNMMNKSMDLRGVVRNLNPWVHSICFINFRVGSLGFLLVLSKNPWVHVHPRNPRRLRPCVLMYLLTYLGGSPLLSVAGA